MTLLGTPAGATLGMLTAIGMPFTVSQVVLTGASLTFAGSHVSFVFMTDVRL